MCSFKHRFLLLTFLLAVTFFFLSAFLPVGNLAGADELMPSSNIPIITYKNGQQELQAPDWTKITFSSFPAIEEPGWLEVGSALVKKLGYNPTRVWKAGATTDRILMLGDVEDAFHLEAFSLNDISSLTELAMQNLNLNDFGLMHWQSPKSLIKAIPQLGSLSIDRVAPIRDLWQQNGGWGSSSIAQAIRQNPTFGNLLLDRLDLSRYSLQSIPGLSQTAINKFSSWQQSFITEVPGLSAVPFSQFPVPLVGNGVSIAITDIVWSDIERGDPNAQSELFISGTVNKKDRTVPVPCEVGQPCGYIELSDPVGVNGPMHGKRWVSGNSQKVKGGFGPLKAVNNGWEPTGKLVFGPAFKVVLTKTDEPTGSASFALYFRACARIPFYGKSCTPYFIGGVPWFPTKEQGLVIVASTTKPDVKVPAKYQSQINQIQQQYEPEQQELEGVAGSNLLCGKGPGGVDFKALADATSSIEGNYNSIGKWGCDSARNCGRGLGRYQLMTYRSDVKQAIVSQPGGQQFYARLASGYTPSTAELNQYFSPSAQDRLFVNAQTQNINYLLRRGASGEGLVACLGQMWYSGSCSNGSGRDYIGGPTIREYGQTLVRNYRKAVQANGSHQKCAIATSRGNPQATGKLSNPAPNAPITSEFGWRKSPCKGCSSDHKGIDIAVPNGAPVKAADGGTVVYAGSAKGYGNVLVIDHGNGLQTRYAHLEGFAAKTGASVAPGQTVATADSTGVGTGAHLHFEVRENASRNKYPFDPSIMAVNPRKYVNFNR